MAADLFELANRLSVLLAARRPQWVEQIGVDGAPATLGAGVALEDSPRTLVLVDLRREAHRRTVSIQIVVLDLAGTYRLTLDGTDVDFDASAAVPLPTDVPTLLEAWADAVNADPAAALIVEASAEDTDGDGDADTLFLRGLTEAEFSCAYATFAGTAEVAVTADASGCDLRAWFLGKEPNNPDRWRVSNNGAYAVTRRGWLERFDTAGLARLYVEIVDAVGQVGDGAAAPSTFDLWSQVTIGPSVDERIV
jgi:hypothetical protein